MTSRLPDDDDGATPPDPPAVPPAPHRSRTRPPSGSRDFPDDAGGHPIADDDADALPLLAAAFPDRAIRRPPCHASKHSFTPLPNSIDMTKKWKFGARFVGAPIHSDILLRDILRY